MIAKILFATAFLLLACAPKPATRYVATGQLAVRGRRRAWADTAVVLDGVAPGTGVIPFLAIFPGYRAPGPVDTVAVIDSLGRALTQVRRFGPAGELREAVSWWEGRAVAVARFEWAPFERGLRVVRAEIQDSSGVETIVVE